MKPANNTDLTRQWLIRSQRDFETAQTLGEHDLRDTAVYHCQQCAEKVIKAFLIFHGINFERTHDVETLIIHAAGVNSQFLSIQIDGGLLTPFATAFRYPTEPFFDSPSRVEFEVALAAMQHIYSFVLAALPDEVHPS